MFCELFQHKDPPSGGEEDWRRIRVTSQGPAGSGMQRVD